ncbi:GLPGLI family protein [Aestuariivivens sp. NBU2969]|uniref:GLPGLI family protein n=1 Tax=Aestuariivivens sp. NBU2969 TaxID=2873267 RepID=UPI001CBEF4B3|nr:GLPGLI family protein [Aestuariivivens sp. NBU2969]
MKQLIIICLAFCQMQHTFAQDFQGIATYKSSRKLDIQLDSTQMNSEMHQRMMDMMKKQFQKTYLLSFNKSASIYKEDKELGPRQPMGMEVIIVSSGDSDILYKNLKENRFTNQNESFSRLFLIQDELQKHDWTLTNEKKFIGAYECFKATKMIEVPIMRTRISMNGDRDLDAEEENNDPETRMQEVVAWYAPKIPVNNGPANYHGLPGLILEINDGTTTIICSKIVLNPEKGVRIVEPKKGDKMNQEKYDAIMEKKMNEMQDRMRDNRRVRDDGAQELEIRISG